MITEFNLKLYTGWKSDWIGSEVGFDYIDCVSLYTGVDQNGIEYSMYINSFTGELLEMWQDR